MIVSFIIIAWLIFACYALIHCYKLHILRMTIHVLNNQPILVPNQDREVIPIRVLQSTPIREPEIVYYDRAEPVRCRKSFTNENPFISRPSFKSKQNFDSVINELKKFNLDRKYY